ncbi:MAG: acyl-CoA thioesterase domain-containing protein, partial [Caulobacterales bacterium]
MNDARGPLPNYFYTREGDAFAPTLLSQSPWDGRAQSGQAIAALVAHTLEASGDLGNAQIARFTLDILRPAPMAPTRVTWRVARAGRRVRLLEGVFLAGGDAAVKATVLAVAPDAPHPASQELPPPPISPEAAPRIQIADRITGLDTRLVRRRGENAARYHSFWVRVSAEVAPGIA